MRTEQSISGRTITAIKQHTLQLTIRPAFTVTSTYIYRLLTVYQNIDDYCLSPDVEHLLKCRLSERFPHSVILTQTSIQCNVEQGGRYKLNLLYGSAWCAHLSHTESNTYRSAASSGEGQGVKWWTLSSLRSRWTMLFDNITPTSAAAQHSTAVHPRTRSAKYIYWNVPSTVMHEKSISTGPASSTGSAQLLSSIARFT